MAITSPSGYNIGNPHIPVSTSQPYSYRDTDSLLDALYKLRRFVKDLTNTFNALVDDYNSYTQSNDENISDIHNQIQDMLTELGTLQDALSKFENTAIAYNPTTGSYEDTKKVNRDMFRNLAVFGARVSQLAALTAADAAKHTAIDTAVTGNLTIFNNAVPRVTPVNGGEQS